MAKPGPKPKLSIVTEREGNPGHRTKEQLKPGVRLKPGVPSEPSWSEIFVARAVFVPRRARGESIEDRDRRESLALDREDAKADARLAAGLASDVWRRVVRILDAQGLVSDLDWLALEDLAVTVVRIRQLERDISRRGFTVEGQKGSARNGSIVSANQYRAQLRWLAGELGLTPAARDGLLAPDPGGEHGEEGDDDFDV